MEMVVNVKSHGSERRRARARAEVNHMHTYVHVRTLAYVHEYIQHVDDVSRTHTHITIAIFS